ncbi:RIP metalloprotease RseP [Alkaliphilus hydrothermalis]|uniref:Zinc metalloprotease n=1 Tax=Alkaliphilus hydrothermalis TaxID=1482730 RepID=A0ABS2NL98_9FIRM|nr:RIP metalloprotease RseP [Alkaliphilus hydrothermalis]MBM7613698.1 regulator of sigma E protease [Alkaliphilus hydrothermalis]
MQTALSAIIVFGALVFFHELGHFAIAKMVGIKVHEFAIGMGPKLLGFIKGETQYSIRILPIGGYVRMEGEDEASEDARSFSKKSVPARLGVIVAGPIMNFILGLLLFTLLFYNVGGNPTTIIAETLEGSPAQVMQLQEGDKVVSIDGKEINNWGDLETAIAASEGNAIDIQVLRNGETITKSIDPMLEEETGKVMIGIVPEYEKSLSGAVRSSFKNFNMVVTEIFSFLGRLVSGKASSEEVAGPVGIISLVGEASQAGWLNLVFLAALISINLGLMNLLPIPALDGSRLLFLLVELFRGKPVDPDKEGMIHMVGFAILISLMVFVTYKDIVKLFN